VGVLETIGLVSGVLGIGDLVYRTARHLLQKTAIGDQSSPQPPKKNG
jgi:hypothetical protein